MTMTTSDHPSLAAEDVVGGYMHTFKALHGRTPRVRHMGGQWFQVGSEIVHQTTLEQEVMRLRAILQKQQRTDKGLITRLIGRLRNL